MALFFMEKGILGNHNIWNPFQVYPTNMLQLAMDYMRVLLEGASPSDIMALVHQHKMILGSGLGLYELFLAAGMTGTATIQRLGLLCYFYNMYVMYDTKYYMQYTAACVDWHL